jgi:hypothetical protein
MPDKTVSNLSYTASGLFIVYVFFMIATVYFATLQTSLAASVRETEGGITQLEKSYYDGVAVVSSANPHGAGYVTPSDVRYAEARTSTGLTFAGN